MDRGKPQRRFTSAHAIAIAALFFALGGGAYAVSTLPANSVGTKQLQNHAVTPSKLARSAHKLTVEEKKEIQKIVKRWRPRGPMGPQGPKGEQGEPGPSKLFVAGAAAGSLGPSFAVVASIAVPAGQYLLQAKSTINGNASGAAGAASCFLGTGLDQSEIWDGEIVSYPALPSTLTGTGLSLAGAAAFDSERTVALVCKTLEGTVDFDDARVWATKVGSIQGLPVPVD